MVQTGLGAVVISIIDSNPYIQPLVGIMNVVGNNGPAVHHKRAAIVDNGSALGSALGSDEDHAEGPPGTIYSGGRCILEHRHALNILRVDHGKASFHTVNQDE